MEFVEAMMKVSNADLQLIHKIARRSEDLKIGSGDRQGRNMDLIVAQAVYNLDLVRFLESDEQNFAHDFMGIQQKIDRETCSFNDEFWLPRFAR